MCQNVHIRKSLERTGWVRCEDKCEKDKPKRVETFCQTTSKKIKRANGTNIERRTSRSKIILAQNNDVCIDDFWYWIATSLLRSVMLLFSRAKPTYTKRQSILKQPYQQLPKIIHIKFNDFRGNERDSTAKIKQTNFNLAAACIQFICVSIIVFDCFKLIFAGGTKRFQIFRFHTDGWCGCCCSQSSHPYTSN